MPLTVADLSEEALLARFVPLLGGTPHALVGSGDDSAVVAAPDGRFTVSTDVLVQDQHFRLRWSTGADVGWRAAMQNLADAAAMGACPTSIVVALVLPPATAVAWVEDFARGLAAACAQHGVEVVGGDLSAGPVIVAAVTVHGDLQGRSPVLRSGATVGDQVIHAGVRGWSAAGLASLNAGYDVTDPKLAAVVAGYLRPDPPIAAGLLAALAGATAMIDVSDGLVRDARRIAAASGVVIDFDDPWVAFAADVPVLRRARAVIDAGSDTGGLDRAEHVIREWLLAGGEDHGILATIPADSPLPAGFTRVGTVLALTDPSSAAEGVAVLAAGLGPRVTVEGQRVEHLTGWDHFRATD